MKHLTPEEILSKTFIVKTRGYDAELVDNFLDLILKDYNFFLNALEKNKIEIKKLTLKNQNLNKLLTEYDMKLKIEKK